EGYRRSAIRGGRDCPWTLDKALADDGKAPLYPAGPGESIGCLVAASSQQATRPAFGRFARRNVAIRVGRIHTKASRKSDFCCNYSCDHIVVVRVSSPLPGSFTMTAIRKTSGVVIAAAAALFAAGAAGTTSARADD